MAIAADRASELLSVVDFFNRTHDSWAVDDNAPHPTLAYWHSLDAMLSTFETGDLPANCRQLAMAVFRLGALKAEFDQSEELDPGVRFWEAREKLAEELAKSRQPARRSYLEPITELHRQKVPIEQIARMWGLTNPDGSGRSDLVQKELDCPGSVITPDYVHPDERELAVKTEKSRLEYLHAAAAAATVASQRKADEDEPVCPETSKELWSQDVPLPQAARMLKRSQEEVAAEWAEFKRTSPPKPKLDEDGNPIPEPEWQAGKEPASEAAVLAEISFPPGAEAEQPDESQELVGEAEVEAAEATDFGSWSDDELKQQAKDYGIAIVGRFSRKKTIARLLEAEREGVETTEGEEAEKATASDG